jgi:hypothetical protein
VLLEQELLELLSAQEFQYLAEVVGEGIPTPGAVGAEVGGAGVPTPVVCAGVVGDGVLGAGWSTR